jgi:hypothetical protein
MTQIIPLLASLLSTLLLSSILIVRVMSYGRFRAMAIVLSLYTNRISIAYIENSNDLDAYEELKRVQTLHFILQIICSSR